MLFPNRRIETLCGTSGGEEKNEAEWRGLAGLRRFAQSQRRESDFLISNRPQPIEKSRFEKINASKR